MQFCLNRVLLWGHYARCELFRIMNGVYNRLKNRSVGCLNRHHHLRNLRDHLSYMRHKLNRLERHLSCNWCPSHWWACCVITFLGKLNERDGRLNQTWSLLLDRMNDNWTCCCKLLNWEGCDLWYRTCLTRLLICNVHHW